MAGDEKENEPGDVVLVHLDGKPAGYARLEEIRRHARPGWYECDLLFLAQPLQPVTWILEREQVDGTPFTMGGRPVQIERLPDLGDVHLQRASTPVPDGDDGSEEAGDSEAEAGADANEEAAEKPARKRGDNVVQLVRKPKS